MKPNNICSPLHDSNEHVAESVELAAAEGVIIANPNFEEICLVYKPAITTKSFSYIGFGGKTEFVPAGTKCLVCEDSPYHGFPFIDYLHPISGEELSVEIGDKYKLL